MSDIWSLLSRRGNAALPLVTFVSTRDGSRTELSATSVANAAAKIANALVMEFDAEPGTRVGLALPWHWQRATWLGGIWASGCVAVVDEESVSSCDLVVTDELSCEQLIARGCTDVLAVSLHPFGLPITTPLPQGSRDVTVDVRNQPDALLVGGRFDDTPALELQGTVSTQSEVIAAALALAQTWGIAEGSRSLLARDDMSESESWIAPLALPLVTHGSVVMADTWSADLAAAEGVTWPRP